MSATTLMSLRRCLFNNSLAFFHLIMTIFPVTSSFFRRQRHLIFLWLNVWPLFLFLATTLWSWCRRPALFGDFFCPFFTNHICISALLLPYPTIYPAHSVFQICFFYLFHTSPNGVLPASLKKGNRALQFSISIFGYDYLEHKWCCFCPKLPLLSRHNICRQLCLRIFSLKVYIIKCAIYNIVYSQLREGLNGNKTFSFGHCPNEGGGGLPMPEFFGPLFEKCIFGQ